MTIGGRLIRRIGRTPEARVRWALDFVSRDPARLSPRALKVAWDSLSVLAAWAKGLPIDPAALTKTHRVLGDCIQFLANGNVARVHVPETTWYLAPPPRRPIGARHSAPVRRHSMANIDTKSLPALATLAFVDDLNAIAADRLRACPLKRDGTRCGIVFLGTRGQRYCTPRHARAAAWQAYLARGAEVDRKLRRK